MCGTSADAIDAALVQWPVQGRPRLIATHSKHLPRDLKAQVLALNNSPCISLADYCQLDTDIALTHAAAVVELLNTSNTPAQQLTAIGFHGQTVFHHPAPPLSSSLQLGNAQLLAERTGIPVIADVRRADIALGGQGAPLAPALHQALFKHDTEDRAVVNIGGISNLSLLPAGIQAPVTGYDTGPGNCLLDEWTAQQLGLAFDRDGEFALSGQADTALVSHWLATPYFNHLPPKSTGRDVFNLNWLAKLLPDPLPSAADVQASLTLLTARSIAQGLVSHLPTASRLLVCGGGVHNTALMGALQHQLPQLDVVSTEEYGVSPDWVEAILMAWLARQYTLGLAGNLPSVTGASKSVRLGVRFDPSR